MGLKMINWCIKGSYMENSHYSGSSGSGIQIILC